MNESHAAWVPDDDPERDWRIAAELAAAWVDDRCRTVGASGVLVTNALNDLGVPELDDFERRHARTSRRAGRGRVGAGRGPVLCYVPHAEDLRFAMSLAHGSSIGVVETITFPLGGWAARLKAWNLVADEPTPPFPEPIRNVVDRLVFHGKKGFSDGFGKRQAQAILTDLGAEEVREHGELFPGAVLAEGLSARAAKNLGRLERARGMDGSAFPAPQPDKGCLGISDSGKDGRLRSNLS